MIIKHPVATEKSIRLIESEKKMIFVVDNKADKKMVKAALENLLQVKILTVNLHNTSDGTKRAYVRFSNQTPAIDIATKMGLM